ncbi:MAG: hypothetical protein F6K17_03945 [Okeania sp. SIO3C4]|nr:hypothetical protein [Okeania sp. SIO3C4]
MTKVNKGGQKVSLSYTLRILEAKKVFTNYVKKQAVSMGENGVLIYSKIVICYGFVASGAVATNI